MTETFTVAPIAHATRAGRQRCSKNLFAASAWLTAICLSAVIYQPWRNAPFDVLDFSEFLPFLNGYKSSVERFRAFIMYYASQGRLNLLSYACIVLKWDLFGASVAAWQWARFAEMWLLVGLVYLLVRRLGANRIAAAAASALLLTCYPAQSAWLRMTIGEPLGACFILGAAHLALDYTHREAWRASAAGIVAFVVGALLVKEMFIAAVPFVILLAAGAERPLRIKLGSPRLRRLCLAMLAGVAVMLIPVAAVALRATAGRYAAQYGTASLGPWRFVANVLSMMMPVVSVPTGSLAPLLLALNILFVALLALGWRIGLADPARRACRIRIAMCFVSLPITASALYLPWPHFEDYYSLPYFVCSVVLAGLALSYLHKRSVWAAHMGATLLIVTAGVSAQLAARSTRVSFARREINWELARVMARNPGVDSVVVAMTYLADQPWQRAGPTLRRYAIATSSTSQPPRAVDALCTRVIPDLDATTRGAIVVSYSDQCGILPRPSRSFVRYFTYPWWPHAFVIRDSLRADLVSTRPLD